MTFISFFNKASASTVTHTGDKLYFPMRKTLILGSFCYEFLNPKQRLNAHRAAPKEIGGFLGGPDGCSPCPSSWSR